MKSVLGLLLLASFSVEAAVVKLQSERIQTLVTALSKPDAINIAKNNFKNDALSRGGFLDIVEIDPNAPIIGVGLGGPNQLRKYPVYGMIAYKFDFRGEEIGAAKEFCSKQPQSLGGYKVTSKGVIFNCDGKANHNVVGVVVGDEDNQGGQPINTKLVCEKALNDIKKELGLIALRGSAQKYDEVAWAFGPYNEALQSYKQNNCKKILDNQLQIRPRAMRNVPLNSENLNN
jgi:hypothetical protein